MSQPMLTISSLSNTVDEALSLLQDFPAVVGEAQPDQPLQSLLFQCEQILTEVPPPEPVRTIHHFACTGGTLISKCLAALPNTVLLSEMDPLSSYYKKFSKNIFSPTDPIIHARNNLRTIDTDTIKDMFLASIEALYANLTPSGKRLILRDHSHSHYCDFTPSHERPTFKSIMGSRFPLRSCVTVRHPLDSYLALTAYKWEHFAPFTLEEYSRRHLTFLDDYEGTEIIRYEDFVLAPQDTLHRICDILDLTFAAEVFDFLEVVVISGDSGRKSNNIAPRPRRPIPDSIRAEAKSNNTYEQLCQRLGYKTDVDSAPV